MEYKLIALDMDGTVLNSRQEISPRTAEAVRRALNDGKQVVFATGRSISEMNDYLVQFPDMEYLICENGACVYDLKRQKPLFYRTIPLGLTEKLISLLERKEVLTAFFIGNRVFMNASAMERLDEYGLTALKELFVEKVVRVADLFAFYRENPMDVEKVNVFFRDRVHRMEIVSRLEYQPLTLASSLAGNMEITAAGVNKGSALLRLCGELGISIQEVVAVGDNLNDSDMLKTAGLAVAMGNAVPQVKALADAVTDSCDREGASKAIETYMLREV